MQLSLGSHTVMEASGMGAPSTVAPRAIALTSSQDNSGHPSVLWQNCHGAFLSAWGPLCDLLVDFLPNH
jgi:hypothetical protein